MTAAGEPVEGRVMGDAELLERQVKTVLGLTDNPIPVAAPAMTPADRHLAEAHGPVLTRGDLTAAEAAHAVACGPHLAETLARLAAELSEAEYAVRKTGLASDLVTANLLTATTLVAAAAADFGGRT